MRKTTTLLILFISIVSFGQTLEVSPNGLRSSNDPEKTYVVIKTDGFTSGELYENARKYIIQHYKNPDYVARGAIDDEYINFVTHIPYIATVNNSGMAHIKYDATYRTELYFKDGKVRYEIIEVKMEQKNGTELKWRSTGGIVTFFIYNKKGKLKQPRAKQEIEDYFNNEIEKLTAYLTGKSKIDNDW